MTGPSLRNALPPLFELAQCMHHLAGTQADAGAGSAIALSAKVLPTVNATSILRSFIVDPLVVAYSLDPLPRRHGEGREHPGPDVGC